MVARTDSDGGTALQAIATSVTGTTNWQHMSFSPKTQKLYINTIHIGMTYQALEPKPLKPGAPSGTPSVKTSDMYGPICLGGKLTTASTRRFRSCSVV